MDRIIEEESGTYTAPRVHPHNGYYAGDFSSVPFKLLDPRTLLALAAGVSDERRRTSGAPARGAGG